MLTSTSPSAAGRRTARSISRASCPEYRIELRVATVPTNNGLEDVVMRILSSARPLPLDQIGLSPNNLQRLTEAMERSYGMILCVGPTGSGKTTTLHWR